VFRLTVHCDFSEFGRKLTMSLTKWNESGRGWNSSHQSRENGRVYRPVPKEYETRMTKELKTLLEVGQLRGDNMSKMKETYLALAIEPDHTRYGWMRVRA
jgi:hypothetical protein